MKEICIITGASRGLGYALAKHFVKKGDNVAICSRNFEEIKKTAKNLKKINCNSTILYKEVDVSSEKQVKQFISYIIRKTYLVKICINNAGIYGPLGKIEEICSEGWMHCIDVNLMGPFYFMKAIIPHMKKNKYGKIINLSGGGATAPLPNISAYAASKAGLVRLSESLALECKEYNIDINCVAPGLLKTKLYDEIIEAGPKVVGKAFYNKLKKQQKTPPSVGVELCDWLTSKESDGITGRIISAVWDDYRNFKDLSNDIYTLRRII